MLEEKDGRHWVDAIIIAMEEALKEGDVDGCIFYREWADCIMSRDFALGYMKA